MTDKLPIRTRRRLATNRAAARGLLAFVLFLLAQGASAQWQLLEPIREVAEDFVTSHSEGPNVTAQAGELDPRLRLKACDGPLQTFRPPGSRTTGNTTVGVRCAGTQRWKLFVPVRMSVIGPVLVARRTLGRGSTLSADDVELADHDLSRLPYGYLTRVDEAAGQVLRRPVAPGALILPTMLAQAQVISRGQQVTLLANRAGVTIQMAGKALANGAVQQRIQVENLSSGRVVEGIVRSSELIEILPQ